MKKLFFFLIIILLMVGSFLAGGVIKRRSDVTNEVKNALLVHVENPSGQESQQDLFSMPPGTVKISPERQQLIGVRVSGVEKTAVNHMIRLLGRVAADETRLYIINATVDGWITKTLPNSTGSYVKKNETLAGFYSPEFLSAEQALLFALGAADRVQTTGRESQARKDQLAQFNINIQQYKDALLNLGMGDLQIEELIRTRKYMENVDIASPAEGFILVRNVSDGLRFTKGSELYRIADLSHIWIQADVYENEAKYFRKGAKVMLRPSNFDMTFSGRVSKVPPIFDPGTRTLKVRIEAENPGLVLRPDMFIDVELPIKLPPAITVPSDAILDSGLKKTVFVEKGEGFFEPREVETGWRIGKRVEILKGLDVGEKIVTSGTFLIDSESKLELAAQGMYTTLSKDPVCGVDVALRKADKAGLKASHKGKTYYFDSEECRQKFERDPNRYAKE